MVAVISDVHGCIFTLESVYNELKAKYPDIKVYCVGDLVDRGNYSADTIEFCMDKKIDVCLGNHDYMFMNYFRFPDSFMAQQWTYNGHLATIKSYNNKYQLRLEEHLNFVQSMKLFFNTPDCFISHAGISQVYKKVFKNISLDGTYDDIIHAHLGKDLDEDHSVLWERDNLLNINKMQIVGHTRKFDIQYDVNSNVNYIDTGCVYGNKLTAVIVEKNQIIDKIQKQVFAEDITLK